MRDRDTPAVPCPENVQCTKLPGAKGWQVDSGLTKRQEAAIAAMQGMLSSRAEREDILNTMAVRREQGHPVTMKEVVAERSVEQADALFDELEKDNE